MDECLRVLKESNKSRFDGYSVRNSVWIITHVTFQDCRVHIFSDNLSRNSCKLQNWLYLQQETCLAGNSQEQNNFHIGPIMKS